MKQNNQNKFFLATDGSELSDAAFNMILREFLGPQDKLTVVSISDQSKQYLIEKFKPENIKKKYQELLGAKVKYDVIIAERSQKDVYSDINLIFNQTHGNYLFMGSFGRKGEQENQYRVGKTALKIVIGMKIKHDFSRQDNDSKGFNFVVASDGTVSSFKGYNVVKKFLKENDKIFTISMCREGQNLQNEIESFQKENNIESENIFEHCKEGTNIGHELVQKLNNYKKNKFDFLVVSIRDLNEKKGQLGDTTTHLLVNSKMNILLVP